MNFAGIAFQNIIKVFRFYGAFWLKKYLPFLHSFFKNSCFTTMTLTSFIYFSIVFNSPFTSEDTSTE